MTSTSRTALATTYRGLRNVPMLIAGALLCLSLLLLARTEEAEADNAGSSATQCGTVCSGRSFGNNSVHKIATGSSLSATNLQAIQNVISYYDTYTAVTMYEIGSGTADVLVTQFNYGNTGIQGWVQCPAGSTTTNSHPFRTCFTQRLRLNSFFMNSGATQDFRNDTACHEIGHTLGLAHVANNEGGCMTSNYVANSGYLRAHEKSILNFFY